MKKSLKIKAAVIFTLFPTPLARILCAADADQIPDACGPGRFGPSVANPKFAISGRGTVSEFRIQSHTSNILYLLWYSDLKFINAVATKMTGTSKPPH